MDEQAIKNFREKLESQHTFPGAYTFKFIVPVDKVAEVLALFSNSEAQITEKQSSKGAYTSITAKTEMASSDEVIQTYIEAKKIDGIISL